MAKKWVWAYQITDRSDKIPIPVAHYIVLPTCCGLSAVCEITNKYDETYYITFLSLLGECD